MKRRGPFPTEVLWWFGVGLFVIVGLVCVGVVAIRLAYP